MYKILIIPGNETRDFTVTKTNIAAVDRLTPYQKYYFRCKAKTKHGYGPYGDVTEIITLEDKPSRPLYVQLVDTGNTNDFILRWTKPQDPNGNITKYEVTLILVNDEKLVSHAKPDSFMRFFVNVSVEKVSQVTVRAHTIAGWGPPSIPFYPVVASEPTNNDNLNKVILIIAFTAAVFFLIVLGILCYMHHKRYVMYVIM